jgi:hypothetical protein
LELPVDEIDSVELTGLEEGEEVPLEVVGEVVEDDEQGTSTEVKPKKKKSTKESTEVKPKSAKSKK